MRLPLPLLRPSAAPSAEWNDGDDADMALFLDAYAADLRPDDATLARIGASVRAAFVESQIARSHASAAPATGARKMSWGRHRVLAAVGAVAILTVSSVGLAAAQSGPGQPFYRLRLVIETVNQPPVGSLNRMNTDLDRADARLNEIAGGAVDSDWATAADAVGAYRDVISAILLPADAGPRGRSLQRLGAQLARLEQLRTTSKEPETAALDGAIETLHGILGLPVPTPPVGPAASPRPSDHDISGPHESSNPSPGGSDSSARGGDSGGGGSDHGSSGTPGPTSSHGGAGDNGSGPGIGGSDDSGGDKPSPTPNSTDHDGHLPGATELPAGGH